MRRKSQRTFKAIVEVLDDGGWHTIDDVEAVTPHPAEWVQQLRTEGVIEFSEDLVPMVRLRDRLLVG